MDPAYLSAVAALAGSTIGSVTSLTASWLTQRVQFRAEQYTRDLSRREDLYKNFIEEASRLYADAYQRDDAKVTDLVNLYALVSRMRVRSSQNIVEHADGVVRAIIEAYRAPNKTFRDVSEILDNADMNPLRNFSNACREELHGYGVR
jgi:hypothetical protein